MIALQRGSKVRGNQARQNPRAQGPIHPDILPVITIANLRRVQADRSYCEICAEELADVLFELELDRVGCAIRL